MRCLEARGELVMYSRTIKDMYDGAKILVKTIGRDSEHLPILIGLHHKSTLNSFLFVLILDESMWKIQSEVPCGKSKVKCHGVCYLGMP